MKLFSLGVLTFVFSLMIQSNAGAATTVFPFEFQPVLCGVNLVPAVAVPDIEFGGDNLVKGVEMVCLGRLPTVGLSGVGLTFSNGKRPAVYVLDGDPVSSEQGLFTFVLRVRGEEVARVSFRMGRDKLPEEAWGHSLEGLPFHARLVKIGDGSNSSLSR